MRASDSLIRELVNQRIKIAIFGVRRARRISHFRCFLRWFGLRDGCAGLFDIRSWSEPLQYRRLRPIGVRSRCSGAISNLLNVAFSGLGTFQLHRFGLFPILGLIGSQTLRHPALQTGRVHEEALLHDYY